MPQARMLRSDEILAIAKRKFHSKRMLDLMYGM